jgi:peptidoglycan glycosyltransferase
VNGNIRRLGTAFLIIFILITADLVYWQIIDAGALSARSDNPRNQIFAAQVRRGRIYDRNGVLLAGRWIDANGFVHRTYVDSSLAQVIGYDSDIYGKTGIEASYDSYLSGKSPGTDWTEVINRWLHRPVTGDDVMLTIDERIQRAVAAALPNTPSAAVVADPRTGEILAMVSKPYFDPNALTGSKARAYWASLLADPEHPLINRVTGGLYAPGSTFKIVTLSAALDSGVASLSTPFKGAAATGPVVIDGHIFASGNNLPPGVTSVDLLHAFMYSDNIVFAQVGVKIGASRFLDYAHRFGVGQPIPFDIPVSISHVRNPGERFDQVALASSAFGQAYDHVTPLQMLLITEGIADQGRIPEPILVKQITAPDGSIVTRNTPSTLATPIRSTTAAQVTTAMTDVVTAGSGFETQIPGVAVAGKTGTAETGDGLAPHAWFVCFAPADHPRVAVAVIVEHGGEGAFVAAPIARQILETALPLVK